MDDKKVKERRIVSEEVYDQINSRLPWMIRKGLGAIFLLIIVTMSCAGLISYPESVPVAIKVVPSEKPIRFLFPDSVGLTSLSHSGCEVSAGDQIAVIPATPPGTGCNSLRSPVAGRFYVGYDYDHMSTVLQIIPDSTKYSCWGKIGDGYAAKMVLGMIVRIKLKPGAGSGGYFRGRVAAISSFPVDHLLTFRVSVDSPMVDANKLFLGGSGDLDGTGDLEISQTSILSRVFIQFFHLKRVNP